LSQILKLLHLRYTYSYTKLYKNVTLQSIYFQVIFPLITSGRVMEWL